MAAGHRDGRDQLGAQLVGELLASAPAAMAGGSAVVKMKPEAKERIASQSAAKRRCSRPSRRSLGERALDDVDAVA
jgi:hypothetical protein